jgi:hypothetical protein
LAYAGQAGELNPFVFRDLTVHENEKTHLLIFGLFETLKQVYFPDTFKTLFADGTVLDGLSFILKAGVCIAVTHNIAFDFILTFR